MVELCCELFLANDKKKKSHNDLLVLKNMCFLQPFIAESCKQPVKLKVELSKSTDHDMGFVLFDEAQTKIALLSAGMTSREETSMIVPNELSSFFANANSSTTTELNPLGFYAEYTRRGLQFGESYQLIHKLLVDKASSKAFAVLEWPSLITLSKITDSLMPLVPRANDCVFPPQLLDAIIHTAGCLHYHTGGSSFASGDDLLVPFTIESLAYDWTSSFNPTTEKFELYVELKNRSSQGIECNCYLFHERSNKWVFQMNGLMLRKIQRGINNTSLAVIAANQLSDESMTKLATSQWIKVSEIENFKHFSLESDIGRVGIIAMNHACHSDAQSIAAAIGESSCVIYTISNILEGSMVDSLSVLNRVIIIHERGIIDSETKELKELLDVLVFILKAKSLSSIVFISIAEPIISSITTSISTQQWPSDNLLGPVLCSTWEESLEYVKVLYVDRCERYANCIVDSLQILPSISGVEFSLDCVSNVLYRRSFVPVTAITHDGDSSLDSECECEVILKERGSLDMLCITQSSHAASIKLKTNQVLVRVSYVGLNFRDVLNVLGMYPGNPGDPGCEFCGIVQAIGPLDPSGSESVNKCLTVGDRVIGFQEGCLRTDIVVDIHCIALAPTSIPSSIACTIPIVFCTVHYALKKLANLTKNDVILIHTAAGGVGLAAIQYAKNIGCTIIATCGSQEKIDLLSSPPYNIPRECICSSRDINIFHEKMDSLVLDETKKITVVLNTLSGSFIPATLDYVAENGRFLELGKRDVLTKEEMTSIRPDVQYHMIELDSMAKMNSHQYSELLYEVSHCFEPAHATMTHWKPLPTKVFDFHCGLKDAFQYLRSGNNVGKAVIRMSHNDCDLPLVDRANVIVTGGTGGIGHEIVQCLLSMGASKVFVIARNVVHDVNKQIDERIVHIACDITSESAVKAMLAEVTALIPGGHIDGVIHAAGVVTDGFMQTGDALNGLDAVWNTKAKGAWWLHKLTTPTANCEESRPLKFFICLSSIVSSIGRSGQAVYCSANRFLDSLCEKRCSNPELYGVSRSIQLPAVRDIGMASHGNVALEHWSIPGKMIQRLFRTFFASMLTDPMVNAVTTIYPMTMSYMLDENNLMQFQDYESHSNILKQHRLQTAITSKKNNSNAVDPSVAPSVDDIIDQVMSIAISLMSIGRSRINLDENLVDIGLDSLGATEFATNLSSKFGVKFPPTLVFNYPTLHDVLTRLFQLSPQLQGLSYPHVDIPSDVTVVSSTTCSTSPDATEYDQYVIEDEKVKDETCIVGYAFRLPGGVNDLDAVDDMMRKKECNISSNASSNWDVEKIIQSSSYYQRRKDYVKRIAFGGFVHDEANESSAIPAKVMKDFTSLFGITELEVKKMDVRQRWSLHITYQAMLQAKLDVSSLKGKKVAIFAAALGHLTPTVPPLLPVDGDNKPSVFDATCNSLSVIAGRISYTFGFEGPSLTVDTACSSSLVALHLANRSLLSHECDLAIVCGVNHLEPELSLSFALAGMLSPDGRCQTFDDKANGYVRGEGCAAVVLKRVSDVEKEGTSSTEVIHAVVKGTAVMQDGKSATLTAPNGLAQQQLIRQCLTDACLSPNDITYIEAHGTGTKLGDPIEVEALCNVFAATDKSSSVNSPLYLGSIKANIGHLEAAAGMAGIVSAMTTIKHKTVYPNCNLTTLNQTIAKTIASENSKSEFDSSSTSRSFIFPQEPQDISTVNSINIGVSSFGYSGTIAHVILGEYKPSSSKNRMETTIVKESDEISSVESTVQSVEHVHASSATIDDSTVVQQPSSFHDLIPLIKKTIRTVISAAPEDDENADLRNHGLDSITATELANVLSESLNMEILPSHFVDIYTTKTIIQLVMHQLKVVEKIIADAATNQAVGALCNGNPWFANYYADNPKAHLVIFGGMAHPVVTWHKFVQMYLKYGINVHIVRLPGRFERLMEEAERDVKVLVDGVIKVRFAS